MIIVLGDMIYPMPLQQPLPTVLFVIIGVTVAIDVDVCAKANVTSRETSYLQDDKKTSVELL